MMARSHVVIGLVAWIAAAPSLHIYPFDPLCLALAAGGSLLPDVDHPKSWVGRRTRPISTAIAATLGHRGVTHSAVAVLGLSLFLLHAGYHRSGVSAVAVGYLSHLAADMLTPRGLRLAWPLRGTWSLPLCRTGSSMESVVVLVLVAGMAWWILRHGGGGMAALSHALSRWLS
jgi:inner membrane protein